MTDSLVIIEDKWQEVIDMKPGDIGAVGEENGVPYVILRGSVALCAYVGVPIGHPLANRDYYDIPLDCHGGLTYAGEGQADWPEGYYWYGWDYGHAYDAMIMPPEVKSSFLEHGAKWTVAMVQDEILEVTYDFKRLRRLAEKKAVRCKNCNSFSVKVIYAGIPMRFCEECHEVSGIWSWAMKLLPFNGEFYVYEDSYLKGLVGWWKG